MASITCRVVDPAFVGIQGIYAVLNCKDLHGNTVVRYESFSNDDGNIQYWFQLVSDDSKHEPQPEIVDARQFPEVSMTFLPGIRESYFPWNSIHMELGLTGDGQHEFVLLLHAHSASYQLEHVITTPYQAQMEWEGAFRDQEMITIDADPTRSPSPLQLPSPIITPQARLATQAIRGIKRKLNPDEEESGSSYKRAAKRRGVASRSKKGTGQRMTPESDEDWMHSN
ncbi:uncharacterized protein FTOL_06872 [Fusarium torulosum]|uniref:Uncharacterized protein n=1 Tax=Fusarium torulosum TaxID=33205 RepID=A0AAE8MAP0_9HYPO|nr:uncharacterized protein FTOL_06872 [Fusarium torulosum]